MEKNLTDILADIILSVGTHHRKRKLSPVEVATRMQIFLKKGYTVEKIAELIHLSKDMTSRFFELLQLSSNIQYLVDWGSSTSSAISFSSVGTLPLSVLTMATVKSRSVSPSMLRSMMRGASCSGKNAKS